MDFIVGVLLGWLSKKLGNAIDCMWKILIVWLRATPRQRCAFITILYTGFLERLVSEIHSGKITNRKVIGAFKGMDNWIYPRLRHWRGRA
jgi:hypothetical protein